tara:strand:- start:2916 stop:3752 length:837 start_codon:yes stop_codon:yes gene_type:complete
MSIGKKTRKITDTPRFRKKNSSGKSSGTEYVLSNGLNIALKPNANEWKFNASDNLNDDDLLKITKFLSQTIENSQKSIIKILTKKIANAKASINTWEQKLALAKAKKTNKWNILAKNVISVKKLLLMNQQITNIKNIVPYINSLDELNMSGNFISDLTPFKNKLDNMKVLRLSNNNITDITPLAGANVTELHLGLNEIKDISVVQTMKNLEVLNLTYNPIDDLTPIIELIPQLKKLDISGLKTGSPEDKALIKKLWKDSSGSKSSTRRRSNSTRGLSL